MQATVVLAVLDVVGDWNAGGSSLEETITGCCCFGSNSYQGANSGEARKGAVNHAVCRGLILQKRSHDNRVCKVVDCLYYVRSYTTYSPLSSRHFSLVSYLNKRMM